MWEKEVKNIYIGGMHTYTYTYSFLSKSVAILQSDGWGFWRSGGGTATSGWEFTSNGLHETNTSDSTKFCSIYVLHGLDLSNAESITITVNHYLSSGSWTGASNYRLQNGTESTHTFGVGGNINASNNSGYNGYCVACGDSSNWDRTSLSTGNYVGETVIDFLNKTVTANLTGKSGLSLSLSDAQIASIRECQYLKIYFDKNSNYYKDITLTVVAP